MLRHVASDSLKTRESWLLAQHFGGHGPLPFQATAAEWHSLKQSKRLSKLVVKLQPLASVYSRFQRDASHYQTATHTGKTSLLPTVPSECHCRPADLQTLAVHAPFGGQSFSQAMLPTPAFTPSAHHQCTRSRKLGFRSRGFCGTTPVLFIGLYGGIFFWFHFLGRFEGKLKEGQSFYGSPCLVSHAHTWRHTHTTMLSGRILLDEVREVALATSDRTDSAESNTAGLGLWQ